VKQNQTRNTELTIKALTIVAAALASAPLFAAAGPDATPTSAAANASAPSQEAKAAAGQAAAPDSSKDKAAPADPVIARVGDQTITLRHLNAAFNDAARKKFYHAQPPEAEAAALRRQVADKLIDDVLIFQEAKKRGVKPDDESVNKTIAGYDAQYAKSEQWQKNRERLLPNLRSFLEQQSQVTRFKQQIIDAVPATDEAEEMAYYKAHPEKFTEPEKLRLHTILLAVDPSAPKEAWDKAGIECREIAKQLREGADFAELARKRSADPSAAEGGDKGWLHKGVLPPKVQDIADKMKPGEISDAIRVLEGIMVMRVDERQEPQLRSFTDVRKRLQGLLMDERREAAWQAFVAKLREATPPQIDVAVYPPLPPATPASEDKAR
jgi:parvulin-like peptidyl-prolyl isomerase